MLSQGRRAVAVLTVAAVVTATISGCSGSQLEPEQPAEPGTPQAFITPTGAGTADGSSWQNAAPIVALDAVIERANPGDAVLLSADDGPYRLDKELVIDSGGNNLPVTVRGASRNGEPKRAVIEGTRSNPYDVDGRPGEPVFTLRSKADDISFSDISFRNVGNGAFRFAGSVSNVHIQHIDADNVRRFIENDADEDDASVEHLYVGDVRVNGFSKGAIRLGNQSRRITIENFRGDSRNQDGDNFAIGLHLQDEVSDVFVRNTRMLNAFDSTDDYWNGDGFVTEDDVTRVTFENTLAAGNTDGGYDLKSSKTRLVNAVARDNKRNFRFWADETEVVGCRSEVPVKRGGTGEAAHVQAQSEADVVMRDCTFDAEDPELTGIVLSEKSTVVVKASSLDAASQRHEVEAGSELTINGAERPSAQ